MKSYGSRFETTIGRGMSGQSNLVDVSAHPDALSAYNWTARFYAAASSDNEWLGHIDAVVDTKRRSDHTIGPIAKALWRVVENVTGHGVTTVVHRVRIHSHNDAHDLANFVEAGGIEAIILAARQDVGGLFGTVSVEPAKGEMILRWWALRKMSTVSGVTELPDGAGYRLPAAVARATIHMALPDLARGTLCKS